MSGQDYIGSKISLISLSDIRYVGILHSINTNDSTVSLENVRSFGTEGRRGNPEDEVIASDTIFDFVVFRGSDIKDLQVFEAPVKPAAPPPPPPTSRSQGMVDPTLRPSMEGYPPPPPPMNPYMMAPYPPQAHQAMYWQAPMYPGQQPPPPMQHSTTSQQQQQQHQMPPTTSLPPQSTPVQTPTPAKDITPNEQPTTSQQTVNEEQQHQQLDQQEIDGAAVENLAKQVSELDVDTKETEEPMLPSTATPQRQQQANNRNARQNNNPSYRQNNNSNQRNQNGKQRITIPQTDFDFESSNAKFSKNELLKELMKGSDEEETSPIEQPQQEEQVIIPPPNDEDFYNRSKSFFDNISCESKERQAQDGMVDRRGKFHEERKLNVETFGQASVDQSRFRNFRGRGRGRGGYYRGNRNRNNNYGGYRSQQVDPQQQ